MISPPRREADEHLDALTAMRLADGEPVAPEAAAHVRACMACAALVAAWRREAAALHSMLELDANELTTLAEAALPQRLAAQARVVSRLETLGWLAAICLALATGLLGWTFVAALAAPLLSVLGNVGSWGLVLGIVTARLPAFAQAAWQVILALGRLPVVQAPELTSAMLALLLWAALAAHSRLRPTFDSPHPPVSA